MATATWVANTTGKSSAAPLDGTEEFRVNDGGSSKKATAANIKDYILGLANTWTQTQTFADVQLGATNLVKWGTTSSFPALKRNSAELQVRLADDSNYADLVGANLYARGTFVILASGASNLVFLQANASGVLTLSDDNADGFNRLNFGSTNNTVPALKVNSTALETKLGDDSAYAQHNAQMVAVVDGITAPSATVGLAKIFVDTADGDLKVIFGDGTTKVIVADT